jgi:tRNA dimethylallyltransferase
MQNTHKDFRQLAIIGSTASGKTSLAIKVAKKIDAYILSLDSLSIYKEIDTVSAKPSIQERDGIKHFGLDYLYPNENFDVNIFIKLYHRVVVLCRHEKKHLIIVGGTSFYLKMLIEGISILPTISKKTKEEASKYLLNLEKTYHWLHTLDSQYMDNIASTDSYRIEKALHIYLETTLIPSTYFSKFPPQPTITSPLPIYQIVWDRVILKERIALRTELMLKDGLIDEVCMLEKKYGRAPNSMKSIGIKETLAYLDGIYDKKMLIEKITTNTARLAKRQNTFNNSQFENVVKGSVTELEKILL